MQQSVEQFLNDYAAALLSYDADKIAAFYQVPMAVYSDQGVLLVSEMRQVASFWKQAVEPYRESGITDAKPQVISQDNLTEHITIAKVRWVNTDGNGAPAGEETNVYILSDSKDGMKISGLVITGQ